MSKVLVITTSLRAKSNSDILAERMIAGARDAGHEVEAICNFLLFAVLLIVRKIRGTDRFSLEIYLLGYAIFRFWIEFCRAERSRGFLPFGFTFSQDISILIVCLVMLEALFFVIRPRKERNFS